jgi:hypothetical protein
MKKLRYIIATPFYMIGVIMVILANAIEGGTNK